MSILIKGMEMPKNCGFCPFCRKTITEWGSIYSADCIIRKMPIKFSELDLRDGLCPLVELPPHGDLVDKDEIRAIAISLLDEAVTDQEANAIREMWSRLGKMKVFIPAEESET